MIRMLFGNVGPQYIDQKRVASPLILEAGSTIGLLFQRERINPDTGKTEHTSSLGIGHVTTVFESEGEWFALTCCHCLCSKPYYKSPEDDDLGTLFLPCLLVPQKNLWERFNNNNRRFDSLDISKEFMKYVVPAGFPYSVFAPEIYLHENRIECGVFKVDNDIKKIEHGFRVDWDTYSKMFKPLGVEYHDEFENGVLLKFSGYSSIIYEGMECFVHCSGKVTKCVVMDSMKEIPYSFEEENEDDIGFLIDVFEIQPIEVYAPQSGDSGSPVFSVIDGELYLIGQVNVGDPITRSIFCTKFYNIIENFLNDFDHGLTRL